MTVIDKSGYVCRRNSKQNWWIVKHKSTACVVTLGEIHFPKHMGGRKVMFKLEIIGSVFDKKRKN